MIYGIGTDIVAIERLASMFERHGNAAANKLLSTSELADFEQATDKGRFLAKRFPDRIVAILIRNLQSRPLNAKRLRKLVASSATTQVRIFEHSEQIANILAQI